MYAISGECSTYTTTAVSWLTDGTATKSAATNQSRCLIFSADLPSTSFITPHLVSFINPLSDSASTRIQNKQNEHSLDSSVVRIDDQLGLWSVRIDSSNWLVKEINFHHILH